jgi:acyl-CoA synthetase (AMP-forming)/AMP-acid ligase II
MQMRIVDPDKGEPVPVGATGEITVKGVTFMRGYYKLLPEEALDDEADRFLAYLREHLASYKVPRRVLPFEDEQLQFTSSDKVRIDRVRQLVVDRLISSDDDVEWVTFLKKHAARPALA